MNESEVVVVDSDESESGVFSRTGENVGARTKGMGVRVSFSWVCDTRERRGDASLSSSVRS